jgi:hypothetical protein
MRTATTTRLLLALALLGVALASGVATAAGLPKLLTGTGENVFKIRPATISYTGDGTGILGRFPNGSKGGSLHWTLWSASAAAATGTVWLNACQPSCAGGRFKSYAVTVAAGRPKGGHFTRMTLRYRYGAKTVTDTRTLERIGSTYQWAIAP